MSLLEKKLQEKIPIWRENTQKLLKDHGEKILSTVTVDQAFGGIRGVRTLICDTSSVPADKGLIIRGIPVKDLTIYSPEEIYFLLLTGDLPNEEEFRDLNADLRSRKNIPDYVWNVLEALPKGTHPMAMLSTGLLAMQKESSFYKAYDKGLHKTDFWKPTLDDALNIVAKMPTLAAGIYRLAYGKGRRIDPDPRLDIGSDFIHMLGLVEGHECRFCRFMRQFLILHSDHEHGTVSALSAAAVNSALSDLYYSVSAAMNGLAGPLHGLANQEALRWIQEIMNEFGGVPTKEQIEKKTWDTINSGQVIPGYGHAVLRVVDPRFAALFEFGKTNCSTDPIFKTVQVVFETVPEVLKQIKKIQNPWPNVDAVSGSLLHYYGLTEYSFYTVIFGVARSMGVTSQAVIARSLGLPIVRPKSTTTDYIRELFVNQ